MDEKAGMNNGHPNNSDVNDESTMISISFSVTPSERPKLATLVSVT